MRERTHSSGEGTALPPRRSRTPARASSAVLRANREMNIGSVAEESGLPAKTIRYYEMIGLVGPAERRPNGYRSYSVADMHTLNFIKRARSLGFSVGEVRELLDLWQNKKRTSAAVKTLTRNHLRALDHKIAELRAMRNALADLLARCHGDERAECSIVDELADGEDARPPK